MKTTFPCPVQLRVTRQSPGHTDAREVTLGVCGGGGGGAGSPGVHSAPRDGLCACPPSRSCSLRALPHRLQEAPRVSRKRTQSSVHILSCTLGPMMTTAGLACGAVERMDTAHTYSSGHQKQQMAQTRTLGHLGKRQYRRAQGAGKPRVTAPRKGDTPDATLSIARSPAGWARSPRLQGDASAHTPSSSQSWHSPYRPHRYTQQLVPRVSRDL